MGTARSDWEDALTVDVAAIYAAAWQWRDTTRALDAAREERAYQISLETKGGQAEYLAREQVLREATDESLMALMDTIQTHCTHLGISGAAVIGAAQNLRSAATVDAAAEIIRARADL